MQAEEAVVLSPNQEKNKARDIEEIVSKLWISFYLIFNALSRKKPKK